MTEDEFRQRIRRKAIQMQIGGFRPPEGPYTSWFGKVNFKAYGETWPEMNGKAMHALCQINLNELPFKPTRLEDISLITLFIGPDDLPDDTPNGEGWCLRTYKSLEALEPLEQIPTGSHIKAFPMKPEVVEDYPCWEDLPIDCPEELDDKYYDIFNNVSGLKLGGWPTLIQSEIFWAPWNRHPNEPEYVFQVDSTEKGNWAWGDAGVGYFGRGTKEGKKDEWAMSWQCY